MRKNVLILGHNNRTPFINVCNQYVHLFDKSQYEVTVAYLSNAPNEEAKKHHLAEQVLFFNFSQKTLRTLKFIAISKLITLCRRKRFSLVICHRYKPTYIMLWVAQYCRITALIFVMHALQTMASKRRQLVIAALMRQNMLLAGVSNAVRDDLRHDLSWCLPSHRIITLYNSIDCVVEEQKMLAKAAARQALGLAQDDFIFGNIARLAPDKNHFTLIQSFARIKPYCPKAKLIIFGTGALETQLKNEVRLLGLTTEIIFAGFIPQGSRYMSAFDCFVLPSTEEAFGLVLLEAMLAKIPIIAARTGGIIEVMAHTGLLVEPTQIEDLATHMQQIYAWPAYRRQQQGMKGYEQMMTFSTQHFFADFWQLPLMQCIKE